jgi:hypothetical protein
MIVKQINISGKTTIPLRLIIQAFLRRPMPLARASIGIEPTIPIGTRAIPPYHTVLKLNQIRKRRGSKSMRPMNVDKTGLSDAL